ncbi:ATP synthase, F1 sector, delta-subunit [Candidatus Blochmanniella pennsylvanica str. BPEN]|uniref:ATP synthase subunit delta n=1 Tax=Blochmanniella pennsylvanica (strain BPEN) TaxID=291272 RepID=ATPD_BLOPB|nr:F0F1 ATP synthase subunit delta [Candidatus Blochmannia pennsylvanicus]Q494C6.1 RecName: Full=ATP synthase subunit delta; AltName: Full=ATP synthase F(1) sector subunit delta; AltName: Full=F-type ATPase subunit delta; Short=F-ATPase subunit delta [Candidatus Blochmannia pennsylvanicus str. BPEN]AAZ40655.1 ATP synthase, F1 sector, delta-subunit [Candidatus Blochmannia pennsylvanicus str. BPEN]UOY04446.1 F0F1 ATP synthase subunit delta [Candidatus Blochmannia pennsylvanicus]
MSSMLVVARTYAQAIFDIAVEQKNINKWKSVLDLFSEISLNRLVQSLFFRCLEPKRLSDIFIAICEDYQKKQVDTFSKNIIYIMAENNRLLLLPIVFKEFTYLCSIYVHTVEIEIISAWPLKYNQLKKITDIMAKRLSKTVNPVHKVDKDILAGVIIRIGDTVIDGSIRGRIFRLNHVLQS